MASQNKSSIKFGDRTQWLRELSVLPKRAQAGETVTLKVSLSHKGFSRHVGFDENKLKAVLGVFKYSFSSEDCTSLNESLNSLSTTCPKYQEKGWTLKLPDKLPDGSCLITVRVDLDLSPATSGAATSAGSPKTIGNIENEVELAIGFNVDFDDFKTLTAETTLNVVSQQQRETQTSVTLQRSAALPTDDQALWVAIRNRTQALEFSRYQRFIDCLFCGRDIDVTQFRAFGSNVNGCLDPDADRPLSIYGPYAYNVLKLATQVFLTLESGVIIREGRSQSHFLLSPERLFDIEKEQNRLGQPKISIEDINRRLRHYLFQQGDQASVLPYLNRIVTALVGLDTDDIEEVLPYCNGILQHRLTSPSLLELIWSYWHEEAMLVQTMNTIALRFQNRRSSPRDPLGEFELDALRPLNNMIWGYIQDEHNRLTVQRRAYEYQHHYGLALVGKAVAGMIPADVRSKFIQAFHNLLYRAAVFYREDQDTTIIADTFPLLNALREVHLLLAEGAHNQFGDLPWTARGEMLMMQWMLARPEMREFLRGRYMVPYQESWMGAVDCMKKLQGWTDTTVTHFHELGVTGERILLSIRYGDWIDIENTQEQAKNWARYWKPEIQRYIHGYMTATGVDLMADVTDNRDAATRYLQPSALLQRRLETQTGRKSLSAPRLVGASSTVQAGFTELPMPQRSRALRYKREAE
jgi:hypothetical protein